MLIKPGDGVSIVAPASQFRGADRPLLDRAIALLESWRLRVHVRVDPSHHFYLAGSDEARAAHLKQALTDPDSRAIFCTRGGYGSARLLCDLGSMDDYVPPKLLVGYSDITMLHLAAARLWPQMTLIHGPNVATAQILGEEPECDRNRQALHEALFSPPAVSTTTIEFLRGGKGAGPLKGGCLSMIAAAQGTRYSLDPRQAILLLEDTGEAPYKIDRMLTQLKLAGAFEEAQGIVFGVMPNCSDPYNDLKLVLKDFFGQYDFPVALGFQSGHGALNLAIRLGSLARLSSAESELSITT